MASELIALQSQVLALQDNEREIDDKRRQLQEEITSLEHLHGADETRRALASSVLVYLTALSREVKSKRTPEGQTSIAGEIRIQLSHKESIVLEVSSGTEFGNVVDEVLDYLGYRRPGNENSQSLAGTPRQSRSGSDYPRIKVSESSPGAASLRFSPSRVVRPRSDFFLRDEFGAVFCNESKVAETFASSAVLWMAYLSVRPDLKGAHFDPEEEINAFFQAPENVDLTIVAGQTTMPAVTASETNVTRIDQDSRLLVGFDAGIASRTARSLLLSTRSQNAATHAGDLKVDEPVHGGGRRAKQLKKQTIAQANEKRNQSRQQGLLLECVIHLVFVLFCFFTAFAYSAYSNTNPEFIAIIYERDLFWDVTAFPTLESYFLTHVLPWKQLRLGTQWNPREIRVRQLRVNCTEYSQCERYTAPRDAQSLAGVSFNPQAANQSSDPDSFVFQMRSEAIPIVALTEYWDNLDLVTDYDATGGYFKYWPDPIEGPATPPNFTDWIDAGTAFVAIEFNVYEPNSNVIVSAKVIAQYPSYQTGYVPEGLNTSDVCEFQEIRSIQPVVLVRTSDNLDSIDSNQNAMTVLCAFSLAAGALSILRGLGFFNISIAGDRDIARAVEVYKPNAGLLRSAMMALSVSNSERSFNPSDLTRIFWLSLDTIIVGLLVAALVYQYVVVEPLYEQLRSYASHSPLVASSSSSLNPLLVSNYTEIYGVMRETKIVTAILAFASWLAIFSGIRELRLISSGVLIADTVTQSILPGLFVLFVCGYAPLGISFASVGYIMFGYLDEAFRSLEMSSYTVVSKFFLFDTTVAPTWRPVYSLLLVLYYTVTSGIAYAVIFHAFKRESSKLVKGPFTVWQILWPFPAIKKWLEEGSKNDLWAAGTASRLKRRRMRKTIENQATVIASGQANATTTIAEGGSAVAPDGTTQDLGDGLNAVGGGPATSNKLFGMGTGAKKASSGAAGGTEAEAAGFSMVHESIDMPEEGADVSYRRTSIISVDPSATIIEESAVQQGSTVRQG